MKDYLNLFKFINIFTSEKYQVKTNIDELLSDKYELIYKIDEEVNGEFILYR